MYILRKKSFGNRKRNIRIANKFTLINMNKNLNYKILILWEN